MLRCKSFCLFVSLFSLGIQWTAIGAAPFVQSAYFAAPLVRFSSRFTAFGCLNQGDGFDDLALPSAAHSMSTSTLEANAVFDVLEASDVACAAAATAGIVNRFVVEGAS